MERRKHLIPVTALIIYGMLSILTLTKYPFVHSDESWLSGLARTALSKGSYSVSEPFFDLYPRTIHALRVIFMSLQMAFIKLFGYEVFSVRLISLIFSLLSAVLIYRIFRKKGNDVLLSTLSTLVITVNVQFVMASHVARQEAIILFGLILVYFLNIERQRPIMSSAVIVILMGVHPNSFLVGLSLLTIYILRKDRSSIFKSILMMAGGAAFYIILSILMNPDFITQYASFGKSLGVTEHSISRPLGFYYYYYKLFHGIGGSYKLVDIRPDVILILISSISAILIPGRYKEAKETSLIVLTLNIGIFIIGRYNQTAVIFPLVFAYIAVLSLLPRINKRKAIIAVLLLMTAYQGINTYSDMKMGYATQYKDFLEEITSVITPDAKVLGNLNLEYALSEGTLYDYRNLDFLDESDMTFEQYVVDRDIEYIVLYEEMEYIHDSNGKWDILYGSIPYYEEMMKFIADECTLVHEFNSPTYAVRIARYVDTYPWYVKIFKVRE